MNSIFGLPETPMSGFVREVVAIRLQVTIASLIALAMLGAFHSAVRAQQSARSASDGVYTTEQAKRGEAIYMQACAYCHGTALEGGGDWTPALVDAPFVAGWSKGTLADLFEKISVTMPEDKPQSLSDEQNADVLAFILRANKFPAGLTELPHDREGLKQILLPRNVQPGQP